MPLFLTSVYMARQSNVRIRCKCQHCYVSECYLESSSTKCKGQSKGYIGEKPSNLFFSLIGVGFGVNEKLLAFTIAKYIIFIEQLDEFVTTVPRRTGKRFSAKRYTVELFYTCVLLSHVKRSSMPFYDQLANS